MGGSHGSDDCTAEVSHISLCAGYGGIDIGLGAVVDGLRTVAYVEIEAFAVANLVAKMEAGGLDAAPIYTDLHAFPFDQFHGCVDILTGGFPCQPFSQAGKRMAEEDSRHLWPAIARGIAACRPGVVFLENVEGIITAKSAQGHAVLHHVLVELEGLGYRATAGVFSAEECGAPHRRRRVFIAALCDSNGDAESAFAGHDEASRLPSIGGVADSDRNTRNQGQPRRATRELPEARPGLRAGEGQGQARQIPGDCGSSVADCDLERLEGHAWDEYRQEGSTRGRTGIRSVAQGGVHGWPAAAGQPQHEWEPPRVVSSMGGDPDGTASEVDRIDRLRLLGNGVVPATAARAFTVLMGRLLLGMLLWPRLWLLLAPDALEAARSVLA